MMPAIEGFMPLLDRRFYSKHCILKENTGITLSVMAGRVRFRYDLCRAECIAKGACRFEGWATGYRGLRDPTAFVVYSRFGPFFA